MVGSLTAVAIGAATIFLIRSQIQQAEDTANSLREAQLQVARAKLPMASSATAAHAKRCIDALDAIEPAITGRARTASPVQMPPFPEIAERTFDAFLAATRDENALFSVAAIYAEQQVLAARMEDVHVSPRAHTLSIDYYYFQPIIMHALAMELLTYGRRESKAVSKVGWDNIASSARSLVKSAGPRERILTIIRDKSERSIALPFALSETG
ncbi:MULTISPECIES: hypothetical protein [unclassified Sphingopyxis]|uniref:hypothetical protein n=1 Tax=unclassified Sphingopyxis TaxID=2614943 RepID=UPI00285FD056|nr:MULTISPECIES: hypothetical protein [unclassified Sphingopyxis]MDR7058903.1 hypothetical protein [Sphingopyxis sp. BE235]MDR7178911.1 hypothetical protein [Sphingopyxis sp. BE249]